MVGEMDYLNRFNAEQPTPQVVSKETFYWYSDAGYPNSKSFTIDLSKRYILDMTGLYNNSVDAKLTVYVDKGELIPISTASIPSSISITINGTTLSVTAVSTREWGSIALFQLD